MPWGDSAIDVGHAAIGVADYGGPRPHTGLAPAIAIDALNRFDAISVDSRVEILAARGAVIECGGPDGCGLV